MPKIEIFEFAKLEAHTTSNLVNHKMSRTAVVDVDIVEESAKDPLRQVQASGMAQAQVGR